MMKIANIKKNTRFFLFPIFLLFILTVLIFWQIHQFITLSQSVDHTDQVIAKINLIEKEIIDLETGVRGFLITGDRNFLEPYQASHLELLGSIRTFRELVSDSSIQNQRMDRIESLLEEWDKLAKDEIELKNVGRSFDVLILMREKKAIIDTIRKTIDDMQFEEKNLRIQRSVSFQRQSTMIYLILSGSLLMFIFTFIRSIKLLIFKERVLEENEKKFHSLAEAMPQIVWITRSDGSCIYFNKQWVEYTGLTLEESYGNGWNIPFHPDDQKPAWEAWQNAVQNNGIYSLQCRLRRSDGVYRWWLIRGTPYFNEEGKIISWFGTWTDIEDIKQTKEKLRELNASLEHKVLERTLELTKEVQAKEESVRIYRAIGESINYGVWICAPDGRNIYASESFLKLVGLTQEECSNFGWGDILHLDDADQTIAAWKECVRTQGNWNIQHRCRGVDGSWHPILARGVPVKNEHGEIFCWAGINLDISELKKVEEELRQNGEALQRSESKFRKVFDSDMIGFFFWNMKGDIIDANDVFLNAVGYTREDLKKGQMNWQKLTPPDWSEVDGMALEKIKNNGLVSSYEKEFFRKNGSRFPIEIGAVALTEIPEIDGIAYTLNISKRKKIEFERDMASASLKEANEILQKQMVEKTTELDTFKVLAESIPQLCWIAYEDGSIFWYNQRWYRYTGTTPKEMEGWGWQSVHDQQMLPSIMERWQKTLKTGEPFEMEFPIRSAEGKFRWFLTRVLPLRDSKNNIINWFGTNTDIDDQRKALFEREELLKIVKKANDQLEQRIQDRTKDLERSNKELEQFAYIASHDLQTPLRHITSYVQLLVSKIKKTTTLDSQAEKWVDYIIGGTNQMKNLITDLLTYSRVGRMDINFEDVDIGEVIANISEILRASIQKTDSKIICHELPVIYGVKSQLIQLFQNLIENALKFKKPNLAPEVEIRFEDVGQYWKCYVSDNGIGIDPKYSEKLFSMFQRLHTSSEYPGTGIGLAICKKIVEFHGGNIGVDSIEGKGSIFFFTIPKKVPIQK